MKTKQIVSVRDGDTFRAQWFQDIGTSLAILSAILGAGFASGREVLLFFNRFGSWARPACILASMFLAGFIDLTLIRARRMNVYDLPGIFRGVLGKRGAWPALILQTSLLCVSAAAMVSAMAELFSLFRPGKFSYVVGFAAAMLLGMQLCSRAQRNLTRLSFFLLPLCAVLYAALGKLPAAQGEATFIQDAGRAIVSAVEYAAMNAMLSCGFICCSAQNLSVRRMHRIALLTGVMFCILLLAVHEVLAKQYAAVLNQPLPAIFLSAKLGEGGWRLCIATFAIAMVTTLTAQMQALVSVFDQNSRKLYSRLITPLLITLCALLGFERLTNTGYPMLGAAGMCMFLLMLVGKRKVGRGEKIHGKHLEMRS